MMLFLCVLPVGYAIVWIKPSWHCGPFSSYQKIFHIFTHTIRKTVPQPLQKVIDYIASPAIVIPLLLLLILIIYYLVSLTSALRGANDELKVSLIKWYIQYRFYKTFRCCLQKKVKQFKLDHFLDNIWNRFK